MATVAGGATSAALPRRSRVAAFVALTKPRIIELLLVSTVPTMVLAARGVPSLWLIAATVIGGTLSAGGANAVNMWVDRDIDAHMGRTRRRPLVTGEVTPTEAIVFAVAIEAVSFVWLWAFVNLLSAVLALAACCFYVFVYTLWLKRTTPNNVVIGGAAGAAPTLIGWSAVTGTVGWPAVLLFLVVFLWTPPHTWALAIRYRSDYAGVDVPMLPVVAGRRQTAWQMIVYAALTATASIALWPIGDLGWIYGLTAVVTGVLFTGGAVRLLFEADPEVFDRRAIRYFGFSISYLTLIFLAVALDVLILG